VKPPAFNTPYDGSSKPFTIGLSQLDVKDWIEVDELHAIYIAEKRRLYAELPEKVLVAEEGTEDAQQEVLNLLVEHLHDYHPALRHSSASGDDGLGGHENALTNSPLARAALLVQEDLVLMRKSSEGWRLVAASLCFPSAWNLLEKFRKPLHQIHAPVPDFGEGTRNASLIARMFDNLRPEQPVLRWNWSLHDDMKLYHPHSNSGPGRRFGEGDVRGKVILRLERQTLRKLPKSGDILFTIRIQVDPLEVLEKHPNGARLAQAIDMQLAAMDAAQLNYKGLTNERERLSARLRIIAGSPI
jgi:dimethylamine monooxygenase subunit A